jgi:hypothetical protein
MRSRAVIRPSTAPRLDASTAPTGRLTVIKLGCKGVVGLEAAVGLFDLGDRRVHPDLEDLRVVGGRLGHRVCQHLQIDRDVEARPALLLHHAADVMQHRQHKGRGEQRRRGDRAALGMPRQWIDGNVPDRRHIQRHELAALPLAQLPDLAEVRIVDLFPARGGRVGRGDVERHAAALIQHQLGEQPAAHPGAGEQPRNHHIDRAVALFQHREKAIQRRLVRAHRLDLAARAHREHFKAGVGHPQEVPQSLGDFGRQVGQHFEQPSRRHT